MFAFLRGTVARKGQGRLELDVHGVGYELLVPDGVLRHVVTDAEATLLTHCYIREDAFTLYGFLREEERALFRLLLGVTGVGPKVALAVLSGLGVHAVGEALNAQDITAFSRVQGVGKKTAQRLVLELRAKLGQDAELSTLLGEPAAGAAAEPQDDIALALISLGCTPNEAQRAARSARESLGEGATDEDLVKAALRSLR
jgi:Holliday junction DNA helicase RuvA